MNIIIAGSRSFDDKALLFSEMDKLVTKLDLKDFQVISGLAQGADILGKAWAHSKQVNCLEFPANWSKYGKAAGTLRNAEMASIADICVIFWDGKSKGSKNMLKIAIENSLLVKVIKYV